jgi:DNA adenine methylase
MVYGLVSRKGGKRYLYKRIIAEIPDHETYVEPFLGSGIVYYNKPPSKVEVVNDLDKELYEIHQWTKEYGNDIGKLQFYVTEDEYYTVLRKKKDNNKDELIRRIKVSMSSWMGRPCFANNPRHMKGLHTKDFLYYADRLKNTLVFNQSYESLVKEYDSPTTFFYLDPPYQNSKYTTGSTYESINYDELQQILLNIKGKFILSINDSPYIRDLFKDFVIKEVETYYTNRTHTSKTTRCTELIIKNF